MFFQLSTFKKLCFLPLLFVVLLIFSCSTKTSNLDVYGNVLKNVMLSDTAIFRGFWLGERIDTVLKKEKLKTIETDSNYLFYESRIDTSESFNLSYSFDESGLNEIESDIYVENYQVAETVFQNFKNYFDKLYGENRHHQGYTVWTTKTKNNSTIRINLSNESNELTADNAPGKISLWIYPDKE